MNVRPSIRFLLAAALLCVAGCSSPAPLRQTRLSQDEIDQFLGSGRDARNYGITIYSDPAGARFEFANRVHQDRAALMDFMGPRNLRAPVIRARTATFVDCTLLLDSSARQNWLLMASAKAMDYRTFKPPTGEYADHVVSDIPGYAGVANKLILDELHVESPVFEVPPARGNLGPLARSEEQPGKLGEKALEARQALAARTHAVMGAALMRSFASIRFDFPKRTVRFSTHATYKPSANSAVRANLPLRDWRGRPAVHGTLGGEPILLVIDTAGDFDLSLPGDTDGVSGPLVLGEWTFDDVQVSTHAELGLPKSFPARIGLGLLSRQAVTLDHKQQRVWFEGPPLSDAEESDDATENETPVPVHYRGITR